MLIYPNAKINIGLYITGKRPDGYHNIETVFYPIPLYDNLEINPLQKEYDKSSFQVSGYPIECDIKTNLIYKIYEQLRKEFHLPPIYVHLYKHIPTGAGLGGGSSDAATMLKGLNELFDLGLSEADMEQRISSFGADCAFFIRNKPQYATGIGNILTPVSLSLKGWNIVLIKPPISVSTKEAYANIIPTSPQYSIKESILQPIETWREFIVNDFETSVFKSYPIISTIKETLYDMGAVYSSMSGSGSCVFGLFKHPIESIDSVFSDCFHFQKEIAL